MKRRGRFGSIVGLFVLAILLVAFYRANNGDVVGGVSRVVGGIWNFISAGADSILSFRWVRNLLS